MATKKTSKKKTSKKKVSSSAKSKRGRWKPGESGNPAGKKKGVKNTKTIINLLFDIIIPKNLLGPDLEKNIDALRHMLGTPNLTMREVSLYVQMYKALHGDRQALEMLLDRTDGKPTQTNINQNTEMGYDEFLQNLAKKGE